MLTAERVQEIAGQLQAAGDGWPLVARNLPEHAGHRAPMPAGHATYRAWVLLDGEHELYDMPVRLIQHEDGDWFLKGLRQP